MTETPPSEAEVSTDSKTLETESVDEPDADSTDIEYDSPGDGPDVRRLVAWAGLGLLTLLALVALAGFYSSVGTIIDLWIEPRHQPIMRAAFNLAVLLVALAGVSLTVRELS